MPGWGPILVAAGAVVEGGTVVVLFAAGVSPLGAWGARSPSGLGGTILSVAGARTSRLGGAADSRDPGAPSRFYPPYESDERELGVRMGYITAGAKVDGGYRGAGSQIRGWI